MDFIANPFGRMTGDMGASIHTAWAMIRVREGSVQKRRLTITQLLIAEVCPPNLRQGTYFEIVEFLRERVKFP